MVSILSTCILLSLQYYQVDVEMPGGKGNIPGQIKVNPFGEVFCVEEGTVPRKSPIKNEPSGAKALVFGEGLRWLEYYQGKDGVYYLVCKGGVVEPITPIGWVHDSALLLGGSPLTTSSLKEDDVHKALQGGGTGVIRKALIISSKEWVKEFLKPGDNASNVITEPFRYKGLGEKAPKDEPLKFYNILFVYKIDSVKKMVLLGFTPKLSADENSNDLAGWVSEKAVCYWDSREAIQWKFDNKSSTIRTRETKAYAFAKIEDLRNFQASFENNIRIPDALPGAKKPDPKTIIAEEVIDPITGNSEDWEFDDIRFPLLSKPSEQLIDSANWGKCMEVGIIGSFRMANGKLVSAKSINKLRTKMRVVQNQVKQNYILFVIDNTGSMEKAFQTVIPKYINAFVTEKGLTQTEKSQIKVAVTFYNDFPSRNEKDAPGATLDSTVKQVSDWVSFDSLEGKALIANLEKTKAQEGGDALEQPIHGIKIALRNAMKSNKAPPEFAFKRLVVVGDMGNHEKDNLGQDLKAEMETIGDMLVPFNGSAWDFTPIQVANPRGVNGQRDPDYDLFTSQMESIGVFRNMKLLELAKKKNRLIPIVSDKYVVSRNFDELEKYLVEQTKQYRLEAIKDVENLVDLSRGVTTQMSENLKGIFNDLKIDIDVLTQKGFQYYERGWITTHDGTYRDDLANPVPQIDIKTLIRSDEFNAMNDLINKFDPLKFNKTATQLFSFLVAGKLGQELNEEFMKSTVDKLGGINSRTPLIDYMIKARFNKELVQLTDAQVKIRFAELLTRIEKLKPIYKEIKNEGRYTGGIHPRKLSLPSGQEIDTWEGKGNLTKGTHRRKFYLAGDRNAPTEEKQMGVEAKKEKVDSDKNKADSDDGFYWLDDAKEIP